MLWPAESIGPVLTGQLKSNALINSTLLEYAKITHPYHPLRGQRFPILKTRRVSGVDTLVLRGSSMGTFAVPQEWTDKGRFCLHITLPNKPPILDFQCLLTLREILNSLGSSKKKVDK